MTDLLTRLEAVLGEGAVPLTTASLRCALGDAGDEAFDCDACPLDKLRVSSDYADPCTPAAFAELTAHIERLAEESRKLRRDWMERFNAIELERKTDENVAHAMNAEIGRLGAEVERLAKVLAAKDAEIKRLRQGRDCGILECAAHPSKRIPADRGGDDAVG